MNYFQKNNFFGAFVNGTSSLRRIALVLLMLALLPTAFYTVYEFSSLNANEEILSEMYNRQLDAILYSVNAHATAVMTNWADRMSKAYEYLLTGDFAKGLDEEAKNHRDIVVKFLIYTDTTGKIYHPRTPLAVNLEGFDSVAWEQTLKRNAWKLERLVRYLRSGYRKIEPLFLGDSTSVQSRVVIVFALNTLGSVNLAAVLLDEEEFVRNVIGKKLSDIAGNNFILGVKVKDSNYIVFSTEPTAAEDLRQQKSLWLFPNYELGIRLKGTTIDELAESRTRRNLVLIVMMDVVLLAGAWFVYRSIRREMELVKVKSDFVSNVSHELRTPLALIRMFGETLEMGRVKSEEKKQEYYSTIVKESERLTRLINNILDFSKMEAGKKQYKFADADLNSIVRNVMNTYSYHLQSEGFELEIHFAENLSSFRVDSESVTEAIINLIDNAIKYSGEKKFLCVRTLQTNAAIAVEVQDRGFGIAEEHRKKIFDTFYRVGTALVHNTKGSGLGLSLVKHIMDAHGGTVEVDSVLGEGSTFRLLFPLVQKG